MKLKMALAAGLLLYASINLSSAQTSPQQSNKIIGPAWITSSQSVTVCESKAGTENCVVVNVPKDVGRMMGLLKIRPLRQTSASWLAFTTQSVAVCGMQIATKKVSCYPVAGTSGESRPAYPNKVGQIPELMGALSPHKEAFLEAGRRVSTALTPAGEMHTDGNDHCYETGQCDFDMIVVEVPGEGGGGPSGGGGDFGFGFEGWGGYGAVGGEDNTEPSGADDLNPSTGQPYPRIVIYPPPPKWPLEWTACSIFGIGCQSASIPHSPPEKETCNAIRQACYTRCTDIYVANPENLPGSGTDYPSRYRKCMRECMNGTGCEDDY